MGKPVFKASHGKGKGFDIIGVQIERKGKKL
jgi:hypothetical protein